MASSLRVAAVMLTLFLSGIPLFLTVHTIISVTLLDGFLSIPFVIFVSCVLSSVGFALVHRTKKMPNPKSAKHQPMSSQPDPVEATPTITPSARGYEILPKGSKISGTIKIGATTQDSFIELDGDCIMWLPKKNEGVEVGVVSTEPAEARQEEEKQVEQPGRKFFKPC